MELIEIINRIVQNNTEAQKPTELAIGTVTSLSPLAVTLSANQPPIPEEVLIVPELVKDHDVTVYDESGTTLLGTYKVKSGLKNNDKVLMLRCMKGQAYIILSRL